MTRFPRGKFGVLYSDVSTWKLGAIPNFWVLHHIDIARIVFQ
jgi:hypothetical protein